MMKVVAVGSLDLGTGLVGEDSLVSGENKSVAFTWQDFPHALFIVHPI